MFAKRRTVFGKRKLEQVDHKDEGIDEDTGEGKETNEIKSNKSKKHKADLKSTSDVFELTNSRGLSSSPDPHELSSPSDSHDLSSSHFSPDSPDSSDSHDSSNTFFHWPDSRNSDLELESLYLPSAHRLQDSITSSTLFQRGLSLLRDYEFQAAFRVIRSAADKQHAHAQFYLGFMYKWGWGTLIDKKAATELFTQSLDQGFQLARVALAYHQSCLGSLDWKPKAIKVLDGYDVLRILAPYLAQYDAICQYLMGIFISAKIGLRAKFQDNLHNLYYLSAVERKSIVSEQIHGVAPENIKGNFGYSEEASKWFMQAAKQGLLSAKTLLGVITDNKELLKEAMEKGHTQAQTYLAISEIKRLLDSRPRDLPLVEYLDEEKLKELKKNNNLLALSISQGDDDAAFTLGKCYCDGFGVATDEKTGFTLIMKAALQGNNKAQSFLGTLYDEGRGVEKNTKLAQKWYFASANNMNRKSHYALARYYFHGYGQVLKPDIAKAVKYIRSAANLGLRNAQEHLARCYDHGIGVPKNKTAVFKWLKEAALKGHSDAQYQLGWIYEHGKEGKGPKYDVEKRDMNLAWKWYSAAVEQGNANAATAIGEQYYFGCPELLIEKSFDLAVHWFSKAAEKNNADAQCYLGRCYQHGEGVEQDNKEAFMWYEKAAAQGHLSAVYRVACFYATGSVPTESVPTGSVGELGELGEPNMRHAATLWRKAAEKGHNLSQSQLAICYEEGHGVERDLDIAKKWYSQAAKQGHLESQLLLGKMLEDKGDLKGACEAFAQAVEQARHPFAAYMLGKILYLGSEEVKQDVKKALQLWSMVLDNVETPISLSMQGLVSTYMGIAYYYDYDLITGPDADADLILRTKTIGFKHLKNAAELGVPEAQNEVAYIYEVGEIVPRDLYLAREMRESAATQGYTAALQYAGIVGKVKERKRDRTSVIEDSVVED